MTDKVKIAIVGAGDLGQSIAHYARENGFDVVGFYDDFQVSAQIIGLPVIGKLDRIVQDFSYRVFDALVCGIGYKHFGFRERVYNEFHREQGIPFATIIDSSCHVDPTAIIGEGVVMFPAAVVDKGCVVEDNVLLNIGVTIAHDSCVKRHSFLSPRVAVAGFTTVGERCMIGINSTIIDNLDICDDTRIGGGAVLISSTQRRGLYVGCPARWIKE